MKKVIFKIFITLTIFATLNVNAQEPDFKALEIKLIGFLDTSLENEVRVFKVEEYLTNMVLLGNKKGRPKKDKDIVSEVA